MIDDYQPLAIHSIPDDENDILGTMSCPRILTESEAWTNDPKVWEEPDEIFRPLIYDQIAQAFDLDADELTFRTAYGWADVLLAENFEGLPRRYNFTDDEWEIVTQF